MSILHLVLPAQDMADGFQKVIEKLSRQIELLQDPEVEKMNEDEFEKYING